MAGEGQIVSRAEAKAQGLKRYFTGKPCKRGHVCERYVAYAKCIACQNECRQAWVCEHPDRYQAIRNRYYHTHRNQRLEYHRTYNEKIRELITVLRMETPELLKEFGL